MHLLQLSYRQIERIQEVAMLIEFAQEINDHDIANAQRGADELRRLIGKVADKDREVAIRTKSSESRC